MTKRRARTEGSIFKRTRPNGRTVWVAEITIGVDKQGKRRRKTIYGDTQREVREKLQKLRAKIVQGVDLDAGRERLGEYLERWLHEVKAPNLKPSTLQDYEDMINLHIAPHLGYRRLEALQPAHLIAWLGELRRNGVGARTCQKAHAVLRHALRQAVRHGAILYNPADRIDPPRYTRKNHSVLDHDQVKALLRAAKGHRFEAFVQLGLLHGMRLGEIAGLKWGDVDFRKGTVHVRRTLAENIRTGKRSLENTPKTRSSQREIPLSRLALDGLRRHRDRLGAIPHRERLIFTDAKGGPLRRSNFRRRVWLPLLKRAKLADLGFRFHDTRHTAATTQLAKGTAVPTVSGMLGHASPAVTMQIYAHALPSAQREAAAKVDELFGE